MYNFYVITLGYIRSGVLCLTPLSLGLAMKGVSKGLDIPAIQIHEVILELLYQTRAL